MRQEVQLEGPTVNNWYNRGAPLAEPRGHHSKDRSYIIRGTEGVPRARPKGAAFEGTLIRYLNGRVGITGKT